MLGKDHTRIVAGAARHAPGTETIDRYYSLGSANLPVVHLRLGEVDMGDTEAVKVSGQAFP